MSKKRTLDSFFQPVSSKKPRAEPPSTTAVDYSSLPQSNHPTYPFPVPHLPPHIESALSEVPASEAKEIDNQPSLDLLYFQPFIPQPVERDLFHFLRDTLFFYRVQYPIKRGSVETIVNTPRYTTVFGLDSTATLSPDGTILPTHHHTNHPPNTRYTQPPPPLPASLAYLCRLAEAFTGTTYNFCLVNYYATAADSIAFHSDDERFLGPAPCIASLSLGGARDFVMKPKPAPPPPPQLPIGPGALGSGDMEGAQAEEGGRTLKFVLQGGDMLVMRGATQARWLHSVPKRKDDGQRGAEGRLNVTFRRAEVRAGTENYYRYNVGTGGVWRWDRERREMQAWEGSRGPSSSSSSAPG